VRRLFLGLDVGTQGTKGLVWDAERGAVVARSSRAYGLIEGLPQGAAEQHPQTWLAAIEEVARELWRALDPRAGELGGVGVSGQQHGLVVLDAEDRVLRAAKLWCDTSTVDEAAELSRALGRSVPTGFTAPKVLWLARREPELFERVRRVLLPHEYVNLCLCGEARAEPGDASGTGWLDPRTRRHDARALAAVHPRLAELLPPLVEAPQLAGTLTAEGARRLALSADFAGVPLALGSGDNMCSAVGAGATREGVFVVSLGTSATVFGHASQPVVDPQGGIAPFCDATGGWLPLLCTMNATGVLEDVAAAYGSDLETLTRAAAVEPAGCEGLVYLPFLVGERVPDLPRACGVLDGLRPGHLRPARVFRAALEGVTCGLALGVERMRALGLPIERLRVVGGGARNRLWLEFLADALGAEVEASAEPESAALGAALLAVWSEARARGAPSSVDALSQAACRPAGEVVRPVPAREAAWRELRGRFRERLDARFGRA